MYSLSRRCVYRPNLKSDYEAPPPEFRKQGHAFVSKCWLSLDEIKPDKGLEREAVKLLVSGEELERCKNHEALTHYASWERACQTWSANTKDLPRVPSATEFAW